MAVPVLGKVLAELAAGVSRRTYRHLDGFEECLFVNFCVRFECVGAGFLDCSRYGARLLAEHWGPGDYVASVAYTDMYLHPGVYDRLKDDPEALQMVREKILAQPGAAGVYLTEELRDGLSTEDPLKRLEALSHHPERSGEIVVAWKPNWIASGAAATHGTGHEYDRRVPLVLLGPGITAGHYGGEVGPQDIAPTLAHLVGVQLDEAEGRVLDQALRRGVDAGQ